MSRKNVFIIIGVVLVAAAVVGANLYFKKDKGLTVSTEVVKARDLESIVAASGKIQPKRLVQISADTPGRVVNLAVNEGDRIKKGQLLLQIDPKSLRTRVDSNTASLGAAQASLGAAQASIEQIKQSIESARVQLEQARLTLTRQQDLWRQQLTTREALERAETDVKAAQSALQEREKQLIGQQSQVSAQTSRIAQERAVLESARYDLSKNTIVSPIDGIVTRRNIQEGETAVIGTMNNAGTVLLTLADMSVIQAEVEVDETNIPSVQLGQKAKITIDALPDKSFKGHVSEIGNSPIQAAGAAAQNTSTQATNFKVVVILDEQVPDVRPGFTCTADITTATRKEVTAVPIPAVAVRELVYDANGQIVKEPKTDKRRRTTPTPETVASAAELKPGQTRKETEGVFVMREGKAEFRPIKMGIAGDKYFEVLNGLKAGDQVITGPYNSVRGMADGDLVKVDNGKKGK
jgi:HlyD family secretion protein